MTAAAGSIAVDGEARIPITTRPRGQHDHDEVGRFESDTEVAKRTERARTPMSDEATVRYGGHRTRGFALM